MAEADIPSVIQQLEDLTECSIHRGTYENPRQLPCLHSFCLQCLVNYTKDKPLADNITCPLCRREITVPAAGIKGFPRSFFIDKVIEIKRLTGPAQKDTLCDICKEDDDLPSDAVPVASMFCAECRKNLCDRCTKEHRRHNKSHSVLKMGSGEINEELVKKLEVSFCSDHSSKAVEMFCLDCQAVICIICFAEKHKLHNCFDINNSAKDFRKQMEREIEAISVCLSEGEKIKETTDKKKDEFLQQIQSVERKILERSEELRRIIDRDSNLLLDELKIIKSSHLKDMQIKDEELQRQLTIIASLKAYGKEIVTVGSASDICRSVNQFHTRTKEVQATLKEALFCEVVCKRVSFESTKFQENLERNIFGRLEVNCEKHLVKDLSDPEKSLQKTLNANPGKKGTSIHLVSAMKDQPQSSGQGIEFVSNSLQKSNLVDPPRKSSERFKKFSTTSDSLTYESKRVKNRLTVRVHHANIIQEKTDVLVSYEDEWLQDHTILAMAVKEAAGPDVKLELVNISKNRGPLEVGQVVHTSAGKLRPYVKYLVHAVRDKHRAHHPEDPKTFEILYKTFLNCFKYSNDKICQQSISIPPIGLREYGVQMVSAAFFQALEEYDTIAEAARTVFPLRSIHFVDEDPAVVKQMITSIKSLLE